MRRTLAVFAVFAIALVSVAGAQRRVTGGPSVDVRDAPWSALVRVFLTETSGYFCTGTILDATHVITAAHCVDLGPRGRVEPGTVAVRAGVSDSGAPRPTDVPQDRKLTTYRIHPGFTWNVAGSPDDVAVLELSEPLDLSGPTATAVALTTAEQPPAGGTHSLAGFGTIRLNSTPLFTLNGLSATVGGCKQSGSAVVFCARSETGAMCPGDSGAALVSTNGAPQLLGIASTAGCVPGTWGWFGNVGAPEIARFLAGDDHPPIAPRETGTPTLKPMTPPRVNQWLRCAPGLWSGAPSFSYRFLNEAGKVLQDSSSPRYLVRRGDVSHRVRCRFTVTNQGGTAFQTTAATAAVQATHIK